MRFYTKQHRYYCGIDLHARRMYICILDAAGTVRVHRNGPATPEHFLATIAAYRENLVVAVECIFTSCRRPRTPSPGGLPYRPRCGRARVWRAYSTSGREADKTWRVRACNADRLKGFARTGT